MAKGGGGVSSRDPHAVWCSIWHVPRCTSTDHGGFTLLAGAGWPKSGSCGSLREGGLPTVPLYRLCLTRQLSHLAPRQTVTSIHVTKSLPNLPSPHRVARRPLSLALHFYIHCLPSTPVTHSLLSLFTTSPAICIPLLLLSPEVSILIDVVVVILI